MQDNKNGCLLNLIVFIVISVIVGILLNSANVTGQSAGTIAIFSMVIGFLCTIVFSAIRIAVILLKTKHQQQTYIVSRNDIILKKCAHMTGLPIAEGASCDIVQSDDCIIVRGGSEFRLWYGKITDITIKTDAEIRQAYASRGAALFGPLGAIVCGRAQTTQTIASFLIFTYSADGGVVYISFDVSRDVLKARRLEMLVKSKI